MDVNKLWRKHTKAACPWETINSSNASKFKMKMTVPWTDYLLCQLSAGKRLSILETLPSELLDLILEELHTNSIRGVRAFASASRTCRALASPYFFRPLRVLIDDLPHSFLLSATDNYKTLRIHGGPRSVEPQEQREQIYPSLSSILMVENTYTRIELLQERRNYLNYETYVWHFPLDILNCGCSMLSDLEIHLNNFRGCSAGWDRIIHTEVSPMPRLVSSENAFSHIARFANLRHLKTHFLLSYAEIRDMDSRQERQAAFDMYKYIEKRKRGVKLEGLDVAFHIGTYISGNRWVCNSWDPNNLIKMTVTLLEQPTGSRKYSVTCEDPRSGELSDRMKFPPSRKTLVDKLARIQLLPFMIRKQKAVQRAKWPFDVDTMEYE